MCYLNRNPISPNLNILQNFLHHKNKGGKTNRKNIKSETCNPIQLSQIQTIETKNNYRQEGINQKNKINTTNNFDKPNFKTTQNSIEILVENTENVQNSLKTQDKISELSQLEKDTQESNLKTTTQPSQTSVQSHEIIINSAEKTSTQDNQQNNFSSNPTRTNIFNFNTDKNTVINTHNTGNIYNFNTSYKNVLINPILLEGEGDKNSYLA